MKKNFKRLVLMVLTFFVVATGCSNSNDVVDEKEDIITEDNIAKEESFETEVDTKENDIDESEAKKEEVKEDSGESFFEKAENDLMKALAPLPDSDSDIKIGAIESTLSNPFWITMEEGYKDAAKEFGVTIDVKATETETDTQGQLDILNNFINQSYEGVSFSPLTEQNMLTGIVEANEKGVKVICIGNQVDEDSLRDMDGKLDGKLTLDFYSQGKIGAEFIAEKLDNKGKVAVIEGIPGATQSEDRKQGALDAFEEAGLEVLPVQTANFDRQEAYDLTLNLISSDPDIVGIACGNDIMALGVIEALESKEMKDKVLVVGVDFIEEAKASIESGKLDATVAMTPYLLGKAGTIMTLKAIEGQEIPEKIDWNPSFLVDSVNVNSMDGWK